MFACFARLRLSDVERLWWDQINLINGDPFVQFKQRKTSQYENLPLSDQAIKILQEVKKLHPAYSPEGSERVFILPSRAYFFRYLKFCSIHQDFSRCKGFGQFLSVSLHQIHEKTSYFIV